MHLIAGDGQDTEALVSVDKTTGKLAVLGHAPGDAIALRSSALMDERVGGVWQTVLVSPLPWTSVTFTFKSHLELTRDPSFTDNLLFLLLEQPRSRGPR